MLGIQFTQLSRNPYLANFSFVGNICLWWPAQNFIILGCLLGLVVFFFSFILYVYYEIGLLLTYMLILFAAIAYFAIMIYINGINSFHLHHYTLAWFLIFFTCLQVPYVTFLNGMGVGIMIDDGSQFGWGAIFSNTV